MRLCNECKLDYARTNDGLCISCNEGLIESMCCEAVEKDERIAELEKEAVIKKVTVNFDTHEDAMNALCVSETLSIVHDVSEVGRMFAKHQPEGKDPVEVIEEMVCQLNYIIDHRE
jgi:hypothetical protein